MKSKTIRRWSFVHTWTSLICTVFLLMLALTGLPLIFSHEIDHLLGNAPELREMPADTPQLNLQQLVDAAQKHRPGEVMQYFGYDDEEPNAAFAIMAKTAGVELPMPLWLCGTPRTTDAVRLLAAARDRLMSAPKTP